MINPEEEKKIQSKRTQQKNILNSLKNKTITTYKEKINVQENLISKQIMDISKKDQIIKIIQEKKKDLNSKIITENERIRIIQDNNSKEDQLMNLIREMKGSKIHHSSKQIVDASKQEQMTRIIRESSKNSDLSNITDNSRKNEAKNFIKANKRSIVRSKHRKHWIYFNNFIDVPPRIYVRTTEIHLPDWLKFQGTADVSVIIPMYKSQDVLKDLINSIPKDHQHKIEYIFVEDACPHACRDFVLPLFEQRKQDIAKPLVKVIHLHNNVGFGQACNNGAKFATGKHLIFLNADTQLTSGWSEPITELLSTDPQIGLVGNMQLIHGTDLIDSAGSEWNANNQCFLHIGRNVYRRHFIRHPMRLKEAPSDLLEVAEREMVTGCCVGISKSLFDYVGGFNPNYRIGYWEDTELCLTIKELGYKVMFQPNSIIYHKGQHTQSSRHQFNNHNVSYFRNKWIKSGRLSSFLINYHDPSIENPQTILIIRKNSNGDVLIASSVCKALKEKHPNCHITFATNFKECLEGNPYIDNIIPHHQYKSKTYDLVYNLDQLNDWRPNASIRNIYAEHVGVKPENCECTMKVTKPENIDLPNDYIVIHPGESDWAGRNWPRENWYELSKKLLDNQENILLVGKYEFMPSYKDNSMPCTINLIDKLRSDELAYVIKNAKMFVGIDSFPMHVAQAQDTPGIAFFGSVAPEAIITNPKMRSISAKELPCISCHKHTPVPISPVFRCKIGTRECETRVTVDRMWNEVQKILQEIKT